jgi:mono/diheme cytochrome c family protein
MAALSACGADSADAPAVSLNADQQRGRLIAESSGCMSCHLNRVIAPLFTGLAGSTVQLADGSTVVADRAYLTEAIVNPNVQRSAGYSGTMPANALSAADVALVVDYIEALGSG